MRKECGGKPGSENEMLLFHGTSGPGVEGIPNNGFDNRYWSKPGAGFFGCGAYFADDPRKSNDYSDKGAKSVIFVCKVLLGNKEIRAPDRHLVSPSSGYHSVNGTNARSAGG
jgi:hypothetical protein